VVKQLLFPQYVGLDPEEVDLLHSEEKKSDAHTNRLFSGLMLLQAAIALGLALLLTPQTWAGTQANIHVHVIASAALAIVLGVVPAYLGWDRGEHPLTRYVMAISQAGFSALLIHISGGRTEVHFHVFASLAFLSLYRDPLVLLSATLFTAVDHLTRAMLWPYSVFGLSDPALVLALEHAAWVVIEDAVLLVGIYSSLKASNTRVREQVEHRRQHAVLREAIDQLRPVFDRAAHGDLTVEIPNVQDELVQSLRTDLDRTIQSWNRVIATFSRSVDGVSTSSHHLHTSSSTLSSDIQFQGESLEAILQEVSTLNASIEAIRENVSRSEAVTHSATQIAQQGEASLAESERSMKTIEASADQMMATIGTIQELAKETNLLALNASIEAARSGEAGRGFAVVAQQVKELAGSCDENITRVTQLIQQTREHIKTGVEKSSRTAGQFKDVCTSVQSISSETGAIAQLTASQAESAQRLQARVDRLQEIHLTTQKNGSQLTCEGDQLAALAQELRDCVRQFEFLKEDQPAGELPVPASA